MEIRWERTFSQVLGAAQHACGYGKGLLEDKPWGLKVTDEGANWRVELSRQDSRSPHILRGWLDVPKDASVRVTLSDDLRELVEALTAQFEELTPA